MYLGNKIGEESQQFNVSIDQSEYIDQHLVKFDMASSHAVGTPITGRLSSREKGDALSNADKSSYRVIV